MVFQKKLKASERNEVARQQWRKQQANLASEEIVVIDESGSNIALTRLYGWGPVGAKVEESVPRNWDKNITIIGALNAKGFIIESIVYLEGATTGAIFEKWLEWKLIPYLRPGQRIVMDNLAAHKGKRVREIIEGAGCEVIYLPAYSPDFSPIEAGFGVCKEYLRKIGARTVDKLIEGWEISMSKLSEEQARAMFRHCGYLLPGQP